MTSKLAVQTSYATARIVNGTVFIVGWGTRP